MSRFHLMASARARNRIRWKGLSTCPQGVEVWGGGFSVLHNNKHEHFPSPFFFSLLRGKFQNALNWQFFPPPSFQRFPAIFRLIVAVHESGFSYGTCNPGVGLACIMIIKGTTNQLLLWPTMLSGKQFLAVDCNNIGAGCVIRLFDVQF